MNDIAVDQRESELCDKYREILENLLRLNNDLIQRCLKESIDELIVDNLDRTTSFDWLCVLFRTFQLILNKIDLKHLHSSRLYLYTSAKFLSQIIETIKLNELILNREEVKNIRQWFTVEMTTKMNMLSMESVYKTADEIFERKTRSSYAQVSYRHSI